MSPPDSLTKTDTKLIGQLRRRLKTNLKLHDALELLLHERRQHHFTASLTSLGSIRDARHERKRKREEQASHDGAAKQKHDLQPYTHRMNPQECKVRFDGKYRRGQQVFTIDVGHQFLTGLAEVRVKSYSQSRQYVQLSSLEALLRTCQKIQHDLHTLLYKSSLLSITIPTLPLNNYDEDTIRLCLGSIPFDKFTRVSISFDYDTVQHARALNLVLDICTIIYFLSSRMQATDVLIIALPWLRDCEKFTPTNPLEWQLFERDIDRATCTLLEHFKMLPRLHADRFPVLVLGSLDTGCIMTGDCTEDTDIMLGIADFLMKWCVQGKGDTGQVKYRTCRTCRRTLEI